jgi:glycosyltransferase involved in cell wall biosynthesis
VAKLTICVPTYNRVGYLQGALASLCAQTFRDFELIVVDNGSTDGTAGLVASVGDARVRYHRNPSNLGSIRNWNRCLELATAELVAICHDDDTYAPDFLRRAVDMLEAHPRVAFVHTAFHVMDVAGRPLRTYRAYAQDVVLPGTEVFLSFLAESHNVVMSTVIGRRACYRALDPFRPDLLCADFEMWLKLALQGDVAYIATPLVSYRNHEASTSGRMDPERWYRENRDIVRRAIGWARSAIPGIEARETELIESTRRVWARRTLREALLAASFGQLENAREYLRVSRELARGRRCAWMWAVAGALMNPLGTRLLRGLRLARRSIRRRRFAIEARA